MIDLKEEFEKHNDEFLEFKNIDNKLHKRPDICAFLFLDNLLPDEKDMIVGSNHDEIYLNTDCDKLSEVATSDDILYLTRCGVRYSKYQNILSMFV